MTGIRRTIYIPEDELPGIEEAARKMERSVSWYLMWCHKQLRASGGMKESGEPRFIFPEEHREVAEGVLEAEKESSKPTDPGKKPERSPKKPKAKKTEKWVNPLDGTALAPREDK